MARGNSIGNPAPYAVRALQEGISATQALRDIRDAGGAISTQTWYRVFGEARASIDNLSAVSGLAGGTVPRDEQFAPWSAGAEGNYAYQFGMVTVDPETGLRMTVPHTVITPNVVSIDEAGQQALADFDKGVQSGSGPGLPVAPILLNLYAMQGPPDA